MSDQPALLRQWTLLRSLGARRHGATLRELAAEAKVSSKTIFRDLSLLRDLGFPLIDQASDHGRKHWKLNGQAGLLQLSFTLEEAAALYLGRQFLEPLAGTYFFSGAQRAFQKIRSTLGDAALRHLEKLAAAFYQKTHGWSDYSRQGELIDELVLAAEDRRVVVISYQSLRASAPVAHYGVHPYALVWHKHALYVIAWSCDHKAIRTFKVDRISAAEAQEERFMPPRNFDPAQFLSGSFGIFEGEGAAQTVRVRFTPVVARLVIERNHHPSQRLALQSDGSLIGEWELSSLEEVASWVLSWGKEAEVLEPQSLRIFIASTLKQALASYAVSKLPKNHERNGTLRNRRRPL